MENNTQKQYAPLAVAEMILDLLSRLHLNETEQILSIQITEKLVARGLEKHEIMCLSDSDAPNQSHNKTYSDSR